MPAEESVDRAELVSALTRAQQELFSASERVTHAFAKNHGLSQREFSALLAIMVAENQGTPTAPTELARQIRLSPAATTSVIDKLVKAGHVNRQRNPTDLRHTTLLLGPSARAVAEPFFAPLTALAKTHAQEFTTEELQTALRYLNGMAQLMSVRAAQLE